MSNNITFEEKSIDYEKSLDGDFKKNNGIFYTDTELASSIVKFLEIPEKASILDPCCGTGSFIYALQQKGYSKVYGCDFDLMTVKKCRELTESKKIKTMDTIAHYRKVLMIPVGQFHDTPTFPFPTSVQGLCHTVGGNHHRNLTVDHLLCGNRRIYYLLLFRCCKL